MTASPHYWKPLAQEERKKDRKRERKKEDLGVDVAENKRVRERKCMEEKDNLLRVLAEKESFTAVQTLYK